MPYPVSAVRNKGGVSDTTAPTVTITSTASTITAAAFTCTFTFSEAVTGFVLGDITVGNGSAGTFNTVSTSVYTAVITPTATGTVTVNVNAAVCTDLAGNPNTAAVQFSILYINAVAWYDFSDITTLFQDAARTTPVTANNQYIHGVADKSGTNNHAAQAGADSLAPQYKTNIQNSKSAAGFDGGDNLSVNFSATHNTSTIFAVSKLSSGTGDEYIVDGFDVSHRRAVAYTGGNKLFMQQGGGQLITGVITVSNMAIYTAVFAGNATSRGYKNGTQVVSNGDAGSNTCNGLQIGTFANGAASFLIGNIAEIIVIGSVLADAPRQAVESYLNAKWACF